MQDEESVDATISEVKRDGNSRTVKFKLHSKVQALDMLCKHLGLYAPVNLGIDEELLNLILGALPKEYAADVKIELQKLAAGRK